MKYINLIKRNPIKSIIMVMFSIVFIYIGNIVLLNSCFYLKTFDNKELIVLLKNRDNNIFYLNDSIRACGNKNYNEFLLEAIKEEYGFYGRKLIFRSFPINVEANDTLNKLYNEDKYYFNFSGWDMFEITKEEAMRKTKETIKFWNKYLKDDKIKNTGPKDKPPLIDKNK